MFLYNYDLLYCKITYFIILIYFIKLLIKINEFENKFDLNGIKKNK